MKIPVRPELPTAALRSSQATHAAVDNSAPLPTHPESTYKSGKAVQTNGATSIWRKSGGRYSDGDGLGIGIVIPFRNGTNALDGMVPKKVFYSHYSNEQTTP